MPESLRTSLIVGAVVLFLFISPLLILALFAVTIVVVLRNLIASLSECAQGKLPTAQNERPVGPEPAYKNYFFQRAHGDISDTFNRARSLSYGPFDASWEHGRELLGEWEVQYPEFSILTRLLIWTLGTVRLVAILFFVTVFYILEVVLLIGSWFVRLLHYLIAFCLRQVGHISMVFRGATFVCPYPNCYEQIGLPHYHCTCGAVHKRLLPDSYGILHRRCQCSELLPTLRRSHLKATCPFCKGELTPSIGNAQNLHIPLVGGRSAGKSTTTIRFASAVDDLFSLPGRTLEFPRADDEERYKTERAELERGGELRPTAELSPRAFLLHLHEANRSRTLLYMYDPAGELYQQAEDTRRRQRYLKQAVGFLLLVDPFSLQRVQQQYGPQIAAYPDLADRISRESPQEVLRRLIQAIPNDARRSQWPVVLRRLINKIPSTKRRSQRLSVVVTKADYFDFPQQLRLVTPNGDERSSAIRQWLINNGEPNLVNMIEGEFSEVRFFSAALQGPLFMPRYVLEPAQWALGNHKVIEATPNRRLSLRSPAVAHTMSALLVGASIIFAMYLAFLAGSLVQQITPLVTWQPQALPTSSLPTSIPTSLASPIPEATPAFRSAVVLGVAPERLAVRAEPSPQGAVVGELDEGSVILAAFGTETGPATGWVRIKAGDIEGWVTFKHVQQNNP